MAVLSVIVMIVSFLLGQSVGMLIGLAGILIAWLPMRPVPPVASPVEITNVGDDFDQFVREGPAAAPASRSIINASRPSPATPALTPAAQRQREAPQDARQDLGDGVGYELLIVGEAYYMPELRALAARRSDPQFPLEFVATLVREPNNPHDPNAIAVLSDRGNVIGHLSREDAVAYGPVMATVETENKTAQCHAKLLGGTQAEPSLSVWLDIDPPDALQRRFAPADRPRASQT